MPLNTHAKLGLVGHRLRTAAPLQMFGAVLSARLQTCPQCSVTIPNQQVKPLLSLWTPMDRRHARA